jgi:hypothetical protein
MVVFLIALKLTQKSSFTWSLFPACILFKILRTLHEILPMHLNYFTEECSSYIQATHNVDNTNIGTTTIIVTEKNRIKIININVKMPLCAPWGHVGKWAVVKKKKHCCLHRESKHDCSDVQLLVAKSENQRSLIIIIIILKEERYPSR